MMCLDFFQPHYLIKTNFFLGLRSRVFNGFIYSKTSEYNSIFQFIAWYING